MFRETFNKVVGGAAEVSKRFKLTEDALPLLSNELTPALFFAQLVEGGHLLDAVRFLASALPKREAVWWACQCIRLVQPPDSAPPASTAALVATEKWVESLTDENRRVAYAAAKTAELSTPAGCAGAAAFWSSGSLTPANLPAVPPAEHLTASAVANGIQLASVIGEPEKADDALRKFLALGLEVVEGTNRWKEAPTAPQPATKPTGPRR